jgi:hypothetical protein
MPAGFTIFDPAKCDSFLPHLKQFVTQPKPLFHPAVFFFSFFGLKHCKILASNEGEEVIL